MRFRKGKPSGGANFSSRIGSFAFVIAIPAVWIFVLVATRSLFLVIQQTPPNNGKWALFAYGAVTATFLLVSLKLTRLRVLIHECKHAVLVMLTGNILKEIKVGRNTGHVSYDVYKENLHFEPFVALAPYFFPLFSLPTLAIAGTFGSQHVDLFAFLLGFTLFTDLATAYAEAHPYQSDLKRMIGGYCFSFLFIAGSNLLWCLICLTWLVGGARGFFRFGIESVRLGEMFLNSLR